MIIGNATRDAELRTTPNGKSVASFAVATNRRYQDASGERRDEVQFHEVVAWGKLGEIAGQIVKKGSKVFVEGRLQTRAWEGQDGAKREKTEIVAENIIGLSGRGDSAGDEEIINKTEQEAPKKTAPADENDINLDDIPF